MPPTKQFDKRMRTPITREHERHLEYRALVGGTSIAAVVRYLIDKDMKEAKANGNR